MQAPPSRLRDPLWLARLLPYLLICVALIGSMASFVLTYDKLMAMQDASYIPSCNISPIFSCGSVMNTPQAMVFGLPNSVFGIAGFSMLLIFGIMLAGGTVVNRWVWRGALATAAAGVIFMHYLFFQSVFVIQAICPWCFIVWMITIPTFWYIAVYAVLKGYLSVPAPIAKLIERHHGGTLVVWYVVLLGTLVVQFWDYWVTLL